MNQQNPITPAIPVAADDVAERLPIPHAIAAIEALLRQPLRLSFHLRQPGAGRLIGQMLLITIGCSLVYGVVTGTFSGGMQLWAAPIKIAGGLLLSAAICLPSLYIFTCLSGSRARFAEVCGLLAGLLMLMTILLIGFAPVAWIFSQSTNSVAWMGGLHIVFWCVATAFGVRFLKQGFSRTEAKSQAGVNVWIMIFLLVALQMTTALRPIIGKSDTFFPAEKKFFIAHWADCLNEKGSNPKPSSSN
ncbi:MAG TPA: hypothetical protein VMF08_23280 [Candidatus Sulfotelmatobacter sp.]|nr:hypothetical protein [Candidatus Sulfotelmatobacter sp.]